MSGIYMEWPRSGVMSPAEIAATIDRAIGTLDAQDAWQTDLEPEPAEDDDDAENEADWEPDVEEDDGETEIAAWPERHTSAACPWDGARMLKAVPQISPSTRADGTVSGKPWLVEERTLSV